MSIPNFIFCSFFSCIHTNKSRISVYTIPILSRFLVLGIPWSACNKNWKIILLRVTHGIPVHSNPRPGSDGNVMVFCQSQIFPSSPLFILNKYRIPVNTIPIPSRFFGPGFSGLTHWCTKKSLQENRQPKNFPTPVFILTNFGLLFTQYRYYRVLAPISLVFILTNCGIPVNCAHFIVPPPPPPRYTLNKPKEPLTSAFLYIII